MLCVAIGACGDAVVTDLDLDAADPTCGTGTSTEPGVVITTFGPIRGATGTSVTSYLGIPFAKPPVGDLRWRPPEPLACTSVEIDATAFGDACAQRGTDGAAKGSEDCLTLNVWAPSAATPSTPMPVMVFIHGGGNMTGSAADVVSGVHLYDGHTVAERGGVVIVTLQYRLNILGYLAHPTLALESPHGASGNYGLLDQIAGLTWVRDNIAAFGGDPGRVLLFGESGGAADVCALVASPQAAGLFSRAVIQSGGCTARTRATVESWGRDVIANTSCTGADDPLACLRNLPPGDLTAASSGMGPSGGAIVPPAGPTIDGFVVPQDPVAAFAGGTHNRVPVVIGGNGDETASPMFGFPAMTEAEYATRVRAMFGTARGNLVLAQYPAADFSSPRWAFVAVTTDSQFVCPARRHARALDAGQSEPVYRYLYTHRMSGTSALLGAAHGLELFYVFQTMSRLPDYTPSAADLALEQAVLGYWTRLAATGNPNGSGAATWPAYDAAQDPYLDLSHPPAAATGVRTGRCDFWDAV